MLINLWAAYSQVLGLGGTKAIMYGPGKPSGGLLVNFNQDFLNFRGGQIGGQAGRQHMTAQGTGCSTSCAGTCLADGSCCPLCNLP
jgi:hypothetical protein